MPNRSLGSALLIAPVFLSGFLFAATPDPTYTALRQAPLVDQMVAENVNIKRDGATFNLKSGVLAFTAPVNGRYTLAVFSGEGEFSFAPKPASEKTYMKSVIKQESVQESFDRAVFTFSDDAGLQLRAQGKPGPTDAKTADILKDFRKRARSGESNRDGLERSFTTETGDNIEAAILADLYNPKQPGFFNAYLHGRKHSDLRFFLRPRGALNFIDTVEEVALLNLDSNLTEDAIIYMGHLESEVAAGKASSSEDKRTVRADSYKIETEIAGNDHFTASAEFHFTAVNAGDRLVRFELLPTLRVSKVTMDGQELAFIQEDRHQDPVFYAITAQPLEVGKAYVMRIEYAGDKVVSKVGGGNFAVGARTSWYPSVNSFRDQARYELTFKVPKRYTLVGVGKLVKEWKEKDSGCTQWDSEVPLAVAGFNYGEFVKKAVQDPKTGVLLEGYAGTEMPDMMKYASRNSANGDMSGLSPSRMNDKVVSEAQASTQIFTQFFGKPAFSRIAVSQQPALNFGQSWPTLIYLPFLAYMDGTQRNGLRMGYSISQFVDQVTSHEVAHQWWGHMVGWKSYRDEWISEGFADFSASLYLQYTQKNLDEYLKYWRLHREALLAKNEFGRRPVDAGPISMGLRLSSAKNDAAYDTVVYNKGGYVVHMLRQLMYDSKNGDQYFIAMMQDFVKQSLHKPASTEDFKAVVEKHMRPSMNLTGNGKMDWFFNEWVYGTEIPRYKLDVSVGTAPDGKAVLKGTLTQSDVGPDFVMAVPLYAEFDTGLARLGAAQLVGSSSMPINLTLPKMPKRVLINARYDVLEQQ